MSISRRIFSDYLVIVAILLVLGFLAGCSNDEENDNGNGNGTQPVIVKLYLGTDSTEINLRDLTSFEIESEDAVFLNNLISQNFVQPWLDNDSLAWDMRPLHAYRLIGSDGYSPYFHSNHYPDLWWDYTFLGYIFVESRNVIFPDSLIDLPGAYNVDDNDRIQIYRKFDICTSTDTAFVELADITAVPVLNDSGNTENALPLADFILAVDTLVANPTIYTYKVVAVDGFTQNTALTWEQMQTGYWLLESQKTWFLADSLHTGRYKIKAVKEIDVLP